MNAYEYWIDLYIHATCSDVFSRFKYRYEHNIALRYPSVFSSLKDLLQPTVFMTFSQSIRVKSNVNTYQDF